nr:MAG TPA: hypothetical protein [Bacteriophage sp.]
MFLIVLYCLYCVCATDLPRFTSYLPHLETISKAIKCILIILTTESI